MSDFATRLRGLRMGRGLRQKDLAVALGLAQTTIANYEQKLRFPDEPTLVRIADYFSVSLDELMGRANGHSGGGPDAGTEEPGGKRDEQGRPGLSTTAPFAELAREYLHVLHERGQAEARILLFKAIEGGATISDIYLRVLAPALHEVGRLWAIGEMSVADEHVFSYATQQIMASLLPHAPRRVAVPPGSPPTRDIPRCVVLPVSGDSHIIGARMAADLLSLAGIEVRFLGTHLSIGHIREMLLAAPPDIVAISVTLPDFVNAAADTIRALREKRALSRTRILVGGQAFESSPALWKRIGADAQAADAADAAQAELRLLSERE
jgi:methanogenic corrinoid protein MtbC1/DNA-binding XRE family transcriptional regulator